jgi:putative ATP-dependent endonuclease of OLD family
MTESAAVEPAPYGLAAGNMTIGLSGGWVAVELGGFTVRGFRSLADTAEIRVGRPTILTGANDGGKSAALQALRILLDGTPPTAEDYTFDSTGDEPQTPNDQQPRRRMDTCTVTGRFTLSPAEQAELNLPGPEVAIRRVASPGSTPRCQVRLTVPTNPDLRGLDNSLLVTELRERASRLGLQPQGPANQRQSYLVPLQELARSAPTSEEWVVTPRVILERMPRVLMFSSAKEPDPAAEIREALRATYDKLLDDKTLIEPVRTVEEKIQGRLEDEAQDLCKHIRVRCPELSEIKVDPSVSFKDGFRSLTVSTGHEDGQAVPLDISGTGRRRRVSLAVWEWTQKLAAFAEDGSRALSSPTTSPTPISTTPDSGNSST